MQIDDSTGRYKSTIYLSEKRDHCSWQTDGRGQELRQRTHQWTTTNENTRNNQHISTIKCLRQGNINKETQKTDREERGRRKQRRSWQTGNTPPSFVFSFLDFVNVYMACPACWDRVVGFFVGEGLLIKTKGNTRRNLTPRKYEITEWFFFLTNCLTPGCIRRLYY